MAWTDAARAAALEARRANAHGTVPSVNLGRPMLPRQILTRVPNTPNQKLSRNDMAAFLRDQHSVGATGMQAARVAHSVGKYYTPHPTASQMEASYRRTVDKLAKEDAMFRRAQREINSLKRRGK
jgi:hypothetical protein